jgi:hypothetical protein
MQQVFAFSESAIIVRHWFEIDLTDASMEHGCRVEVRRLAPQAHRGSESASQLIVVDEPLWRADLFDSLAAEPGTYAVAHFHPSFDGVEPCARAWDEKLSADPWQWLGDQLASWPATAEESPVPAADAADVAHFAAAVVAAGRAYAPEMCRSSADCHRLTADAAESVLLMIDYLERPEMLDRAHVGPWLISA